MSILKVTGLCKSYPEFDLSDISFSLEKGHIMGLIGRNGAGKSTTLKAILNIVHPDKGEVFFGDTELTANEKEIKSRIGFVGGASHFYGKKKIYAILDVTRRFYDNWDMDLEKKYMELFSLKYNKTPDELSQGMKVKLSLVMALSHHAELLILDEPTSGLDPVSRDELLEIFSYLRGKGVSILFSTHITSDLDKCADDISYIREGRLIYSGSMENLLKTAEEKAWGNSLEEIMLHHEREVYHEKYAH